MASAWDKLTQHKHFTRLRTATVVFLCFILILSVILIGVGSGGIKTLSGYDTILKVTVPAGVIVLGVFLLLSTILGLIGIYQKNGKVFAAYLFILFLLIICQFGVGGGAYTWKGEIPGQIEAAWRTLSDNDRNSVQQLYWCCGWWNSTDAEGSNCAPNTTATTGWVQVTTAAGTTSVGTTAVGTTAAGTTSVGTTAVGTTAAGTTSVGTTAVGTTAVVLGTSAVVTTMVTATMGSTGASTTGANMKRQDVPFTTGIVPVNSTDQPCGPLVIQSAQTALNYVGGVEVAFAVLQLVGLFTGVSLAIWILVQSGRQKFNRLDDSETMGERFAKPDQRDSRGGDEEEDDGMSDPLPQQSRDGKRKIVVNFGN